MCPIDALRAIAVVLVLLFHACPAHAPGGFIGVDVFFVISGFVIFQSYLDRLTTGSASLASFYEARFRRLAPALVSMLVLTSIAATAIPLPDDLIRYARSLFAQPVYLQNFVLWDEGDYFSRAATKPLLHTWSLAVEEQFYIVFGFFVLLCKRRKTRFLAIFLAFNVISLAVGHVLTPISPKTVFFMLPTRIWQLSLGIFTYVIASHLTSSRSPVLKSAAVGAALIILLCGIDFDEEARFPGLQSFLACGATAHALGLFQLQSSRAAFFTWAPVSYVGKISYVLYLWHWPIISLMIVKLDRELTITEATLALAGSALLSVLTYRYIETPIRSRRVIATRRALVTACAASFTCVAVTAAMLISTHGALFLYPKDLHPLFKAAGELTPHRCPKSFRVLHPSAQICPVNSVASAPGRMIMGDSHADQLDQLIAQIDTTYNVPVFMTVRNCSLGTSGTRHFCRQEILDELLVQAREHGVKDLLAISSWLDELLDVAAFEREIAQIRAAGMRVWILHSVPRHPDFRPDVRAEVALRGARLSWDGIPVETYEREIVKQRRVFSALRAEFGDDVRILSPKGRMCPDGIYRFHTDGKPNYRDDSHVTHVGAERLRPLFEGFFEARRP